MDESRLRAIGLSARTTEAGVEAELELASALVNPLTRSFLTRVAFSVVGDRLVAVEPPELLGIAPIDVSKLERAGDIEKQVHTAFHDHIFQIQKRSAELQTLGLAARVDPKKLSLTSEVMTPNGWQFLLASDKRGNFRVAAARRDGREQSVVPGPSFELSEFRDRASLVAYLSALFEPEAKDAARGAPPTLTPIPARAPALTPAATPAAGPARELRYAELARLFSGGAIVPPAANVELLVELKVNGAVYRFAAARVRGRTFRGLLAGAKGKVWAERFDLDEFPGVIPLVADLLGVPQDAVVVESDEES